MVSCEMIASQPPRASAMCSIARLVSIGLAVAVAVACGDPAVQTTGQPETTVHVAAIQYVSEWGEPDRNRKGMESYIREAAQRGAKIVVLPEASIPGYMAYDLRRTWHLRGRPLSRGLRGVSPEKVAETVPGESTRAYGRLAKELGIYLTVPIVEVDRQTGSYFNTLVLVGTDGEILLHYRKLNPWPWAERGWATKGDRGHQFIDTPYGRLGLMICYDINFEAKALKKNRVDHLLYSIAWVDAPNSAWFYKRLPALARRAGVNIIGANWSVPAPGERSQADGHYEWYGYGKSVIIERTGKILSLVEHDIGNRIVYAQLPIPARPE